MKKFEILVILLFLSINSMIKSQKINYLSGLEEHEYCELDLGIYGTCQKISECKEEFEKYKLNQTVLKVCSFKGSLPSHLICCPEQHETINKINAFPEVVDFISLPTSNLRSIYLDYETCRDELLQYRKQSVNPNHYGKAMLSGLIPTNSETCEYLSKLNEQIVDGVLDLSYYKCSENNETLSVDSFGGIIFGSLVEKGDRPNMAAIGWTQPNNEIVYNCGGSIISERFIVTAAHCQYHEKKQADTVRLGDRYLKTEEDDEHAQQLKIENFILHPNYTSEFRYNDIALIKTDENIIFNEYVAPSCIGNSNSFEGDWTASGYGVTENGVSSNILLELYVYFVPKEECKENYRNNKELPFGIMDSQICIRSPEFEGRVSNTCFGESGSPLQFKSPYEMYSDDFETSYLSTVYQTSTVIGIESVGTSCGLESPSVFTRLDYYLDWIDSVIENK